MLARREAARIAFIRADHSATLRRALHARSRPERLTFQTGDIVMFWRSRPRVLRMDRGCMGPQRFSWLKTETCLGESLD